MRVMSVSRAIDISKIYKVELPPRVQALPFYICSLIGIQIGRYAFIKRNIPIYYSVDHIPFEILHQIKFDSSPRRGADFAVNGYGSGRDLYHIGNTICRRKAPFAPWQDGVLTSGYELGALPGIYPQMDCEDFEACSSTCRATTE